MRGKDGGQRHVRRGAAAVGADGADAGAIGSAGAGAIGAGPVGAAGAGRKPRRRDRRGRGVRGHLAPLGVPVHRTRSEAFDDLVLDAVDELEEHWSGELAALEFAVEDVPPEPDSIALDSETVLDRGVPLGRLFRDGLPEILQPVIVVYRRPIEARAMDQEDRADLVFMVVVDLAAEFLGRDVDEIG